MNSSFDTILKVARENYIEEPLIVGGIPRDIYLGLPKTNDIDLTTNTSDSTRLGISSSIEIGAPFKVFSDGHVSLYTTDGAVDFSGNFVSEKAVSYYESEYGKVSDDMREIVSRDFTINTLHRRFDETNLIDKTGFAIRDLDKKIVRTISSPDICFEDDVRRVFRAINFAARFNFEVDGAIINFCLNNYDFISQEMGKSLRDAFVTNIISSSINANSDITVGLVMEMGIMHLIPLVGEYKEALIKRRLVAKYLDEASASK